MATRHVNTEQAVLRILERSSVMTMDEIINVGQPDFTWSEIFLAIDRLSRNQLIILFRTGYTYRVALSMLARPTTEAAEPEGSAARV